MIHFHMRLQWYSYTRYNHFGNFNSIKYAFYALFQIKNESYNFVDGNTNPQPDEFPDDYFEAQYPELYHIYRLYAVKQK